MDRPVSATVIDMQAGRDTPEAFVESFEALLADADFASFLKLLGVGRFSPLARRRAEPVFTALCAGLWHLAMRRAFPERSEQAYELWQSAQWSRYEDADAFMVLLRDVAHDLPEQSGADFTPAARGIFVRARKEADQAALVGMALYLRRLHDYFFNHLI